ncbi:MAG TPA: hypothetical protein VKG02_20500 [Blastocatellia bacterium]|nr:hypothetical protein [Blastocatellia bacterium]
MTGYTGGVYLVTVNRNVTGYSRIVKSAPLAALMICNERTRYAGATQQFVAVRLALRGGGLLFIRADKRADGGSGADRVHRTF